MKGMKTKPIGGFSNCTVPAPHKMPMVSPKMGGAKGNPVAVVAGLGKTNKM